MTAPERVEIEGAGEIIQRLSEQEGFLNRRVEAARVSARETVQKAQTEAERLRDEAKLRLAEEMGALRRERARETELALSALDQEIAVRIEALRQRARENRERALRFLLLRITGEAG